MTIVMNRTLSLTAGTTTDFLNKVGNIVIYTRKIEFQYTIRSGTLEMNKTIDMTKDAHLYLTI